MLDVILDFIKSEKFYLPIIYIIIGLVGYSLINRMIGGISKFDIKKGRGVDKRKNTVVVLVKSIIKYVIAVIVIIMILDLYGVNTASLIASLGVATAILGLAFQDTIKDFLAGIFLIFDNAYAVGDWVKIDDFSGEVVALGLKNTKVKSYTGEVMVLSNSSFTKVINYNLNHSKAMIYIPVSYNVKIEELESVLLNVKKIVEKDKDIYSMDLLGIDSFDDSCMKYVVVIDCSSMTHFGGKRKVLREIKIAFDEKGIEIPYNQIDVHLDK